MKRKELIEKLLAQGDDDTNVVITDGFKCLCYAGDFTVELFDRNDGDYIIDIGIGGMEE